MSSRPRFGRVRGAHSCMYGRYEAIASTEQILQYTHRQFNSDESYRTGLLHEQGALNRAENLSRQKHLLDIWRHPRNSLELTGACCFGGEPCSRLLI